MARHGTDVARGFQPRGRGPDRAALLLLVILLISAPMRADSDSAPAWLDEYRAPATRLINEAMRDHFAWNRLAVLTDTIGHRLSGSPQLDRAINWAVTEMKRDGLENVHTEKVMVPKWVRGAESAEVISPSRQPLAMLGLGDSVGTPRDGIEAGVIVVHGFEELEAHASELRGRIVLLNVAFTNYAETSRYRRDGASRAARHGAVAVLVRSIGPDGLRLPHTGALDYAADVPRIPAAALSAEDADLLERMTLRGEKISVRLKMEAHASGLRGRIVLLNVPFTNYAETSRYRRNGASRAAVHGAVAMLVRSIGPDGLRLPHTGALDYAAGVPRIPAAALSGEDADLLERMTLRGDKVVVRLKMDAHAEPDVESANVIGELRGREQPDEIVVVSGHLDSWDVGAGATDDGGGCVVSWEALRVMKKLAMRPRRTVRVVLWTNEENGGRGGLAYRDQHRAELSKHVAMIEADNGVFRPLGFGVSGSESARQTITAIASLLAPIGASAVVAGGDGADITPSLREGHIPGLSLDVDGSKYFLIHHTVADTIDKIDPAEMAKCAAAMTVMAYVIADSPARLWQ